MTPTARRTTVAAAVFLIVVAAVVLVRTITDAQTDSARAESTPASWAPAVPVAAARRQFVELQVVSERGSLAGYDRDTKFPHWNTVTGSCNVREQVLKRDGDRVKVGADCYPTSGTWTSPYDGATWTKASDVDIEHVVPLAHAWSSGARAWPQAKREAFANDLTRPQLFAVTDNINAQKGDQAPDEWRPPLESAWCTYAINWIVVKYHYELKCAELGQMQPRVRVLVGSPLQVSEAAG